MARVTVSQLSSASTVLWDGAADEWTWLKGLTEQAADVLRGNSQDLSASWPDTVGQAAVTAIGDLYNRFNIASDAISAIVTVLEALASAVGAAQSLLLDALYVAGQHGFTVDDAGDVAAAAGQPADESTLASVRAMIGQALRSADEADQQAARDLQTLTGQVTATVEDNVLGIQNAMSQDALRIYASMVPPKGTSPAAVAAWWNSLSSGYQTTLENAVPLSLYNLDGVPQVVKNQLAGPGPVNRMTLVQFAQDNWNNDDLNWWDAGDNCTVFASDALAAAGLPQTDAWSQAHLFFGLGPTSSIGSAPSWGLAQNLHDYLTTPANEPTGPRGPIGTEVPLSQAKPGDLLFIQNDPGNQNNGGPGHIHHTAVVTAVLPNGDILYTQHTNDASNLSMDGRIQHVQQDEGTEHVVIVQVGS